MCEHLTGANVIARVQRGAASLEIPVQTLQALYE